MVRQALIDEGSILDPNGGTSAAPPRRNSGDNGAGLNPSGRSNLPGRHASTHRRHGN
jgi:hypothetical protein